MEEIWKDIKGFEGLYQVSSQGQVRSLDKIVRTGYGGFATKKGKILKQVNLGLGYLVVCLKNGKNNQKYVHRLVYETFVGEIPEGMQVNHLNERKDDNRLENLSLMTPKENCNWGTRNKRIQTNRTIPDFSLSNNPNAKRVEMYSLDNIYQMTFNSIKEAFIYLKINGIQSNVSACCNGKTKTAYKHIWKWSNPLQ